MGTDVPFGLHAHSNGGDVTYKGVTTSKWGEYHTLIGFTEIEAILDLLFDVCGPAGCGETMAQSDHYIIAWQDIGPEICDLFKIKNKYNEDEEES
jgi:hypothetical protein